MLHIALSEELGPPVSDATAELLSWVFGLGGMACLAMWPLLRSLNAMLTVQLVALVGLGLHYALLGVWTAAAVNLIGVLQIAAAIVLGGRPQFRWLGYVLAGLVVAASIFTWQGVLSLLACIGMALVAIGRVQRDAMRMRVLVLAGGPFWLVHDVLIASPVAIADAASMAIGLWQLGRARRDAARAGARHMGRDARSDPSPRPRRDLAPRSS